MGYKGKVLGGGIGFVFGGPWGAAAGATVGHLYDNDDTKPPRVKAPNARYYEVLGCKPADENETLRKQYRKLVKEYHPDAIAARDLPEKRAADANRRFHEIQAAWEAIRKERKM